MSILSDPCFDQRHIRCHDAGCLCGCHRAGAVLQQVRPAMPNPRPRRVIERRQPAGVRRRPGPAPGTLRGSGLPVDTRRIVELMTQNGATLSETARCLGITRDQARTVAREVTGG